jgi:outer membrane protein OmpA-like peptidoglycan-associated protein
MRYTTTIALLAILTLGTQTASAAASKEEGVGIGTGAVIGALAGGPVGMVFGAAIGAKIGDSMHKKSDRIETLQGSLQNSQRSSAELQISIDELSIEIEQLQNVARPELVSLMQAGIDMDLLFRTDEFALTDTTGDRLSQMAASLVNMPSVKIQLDGFADERGDATYNHELSEKRVEFIRNLFINSGIHPARISSTAHGESVAQNPDIDSYALERRVSVKLFIDNTQSVAANPR